MSEITCGGCGAPLSHINAVCDTCLPNFYSKLHSPTGMRDEYDVAISIIRRLASIAEAGRYRDRAGLSLRDNDAVMDARVFLRNLSH